MIRVLLVDDSRLALTIIERALSKTDDILVVGKALNGLEALSLIPKVKPDIICTDYFMPQMNGLQLTKSVMRDTPMPIIVMSGRLDPKSSREAFSLLQEGALEVIKKPQFEEDDPLMKEMIEKIRILSKIYFLRGGERKFGSTAKSVVDAVKPGKHHFVVVGASTGGPNILIDIFSGLPANFSAPIVCVQHISHGFLNPFVDWLRANCKLKVELVKGDTHLLPGTIYLPKEDTHFEMRSALIGGLNHKEPLGGHRPSITLAMKSVAEYVKGEAVGILLTGMGRDGADGMLELSRKGALTIAQNEGSCAVFGMPKEAISLGAVNLILEPKEIKDLLLRLFVP